MEFKTFIGIDVSKNTFDATVMEHSSNARHSWYSNDLKGLKAFIKDLKKEKIQLSSCLICMEHTGVYTHLLLKFLNSKGGNLWLEQAINIKRSLGIQRGKNDKIDSFRIAEYSYRFQDKVVLWKPARQEVNKLKDLISLRRRLIKIKKTLAVPMNELMTTKGESAKHIKSLTQPAIEKIKVQIKLVESEIDQLINDDKHLSRLQEIITSVDGVGKVTAWQVITATNEFNDIRCGRKFACYSGVVPFDHSSGTSIYSRPRVSHMANKQMKELLHLSALSATVMKGELNDYYNRKVAEGKNKMLVLNNIRNKLVQRIFTCVKENRKYEKSYTHALA